MIRFLMLHGASTAASLVVALRRLFGSLPDGIFLGGIRPSVFIQATLQVLLLPPSVRFRWIRVLG